MDLSLLAPALARTLLELDELAIAVSGGVDSVTLAAYAHALLGRDRVRMLHAVSAAVPGEATERLRRLAAARDWDLACIDAGELADPRYAANPVNRCFFCKTNLYTAMRSATERPLASGTNLDDLGEYRPGLEAARDARVTHPFVTAAMDKSAVRSLARALGLDDVAELPASPCLSSRVETGIAVTAPRLRFIESVEQLVRERSGLSVVRCRVRASGVVVELSDVTSRVSVAEQDERLRDHVGRLMREHGVDGSLRFAPYVNGSAFLRTVA